MRASSASRAVARCVSVDYLDARLDSACTHTSPTASASHDRVALDPVQRHGMALIRASALTAHATRSLPHRGWPLPPNGDLRKLASRTAQLPVLARASRLLTAVRAPLLFGAARHEFRQEHNAYQPRTTGHLAIVGPHHRRVIDPLDQSTALAAATSPFLAFVGRQTALSYRLLEVFLQDYCHYLEKELDARVVVVLDGSEANDEVRNHFD